MPFSSQATSCLLLLALLNMPLAAQNKTKPPASEKPVKAEASAEPALTPQQQRALALLDQLFDKAKDFKEGQAKIRVQARIADVLWDYDQPRARRQFEDTFRAINSVRIHTAMNKEPSAYDLRLLQSKLRAEVLPLIAQRDRELASKLIKSLTDSWLTAKEEADEPKRKEQIQSEQDAQYMRLAQKLATTDPQSAAQLVLASRGAGTGTELLPVLKAIQRQDPQLADSVFSQILTAGNVNWLYLEQYVFPNAVDDWAGLNLPTPASTPNRLMSQSSPTLVTQFLNYTYEAILRDAATFIARGVTRNNAGIYYFLVQQMLPFFDHYQPEQAATLRAKMSELTRLIPGEKVDYWLNAHRPRTVQDYLDEAERAKTTAEKDDNYRIAAMVAAHDGEADEALSIISKISNVSERPGLETFVRYHVALRAIEKNDAETAYKYGKEIKDLQPHARVFSKLAQFFFKKKDLARAIEMINEAEQTVSKGEQGVDKIYAMITLAETATAIDRSRGFEIMKSVVDAINQSYLKLRTAGAEAKLENEWGTEINNAERNGNWLSFDECLPLLARADFDRALLLAQTIEDKELSALAQLAVCRGVLAKRL